MGNCDSQQVIFLICGWNHSLSYNEEGECSLSSLNIPEWVSCSNLLRAWMMWFLFMQARKIWSALRILSLFNRDCWAHLQALQIAASQISLFQISREKTVFLLVKKKKWNIEEILRVPIWKWQEILDFMWTRIGDFLGTVCGVEIVIPVILNVSYSVPQFPKEGGYPSTSCDFCSYVLKVSIFYLCPFMR